MVGNAQIKVTLGDGIVAELDNDAPNVKEFVKVITANRDAIKLEKIAVEGPTPEFDAESFKEIVVEVIADYIEAITVEKTSYLKAIGEEESDSGNSEEPVTKEYAEG